MEIVIRDTHQRGKNKKKTLEVVETDTLESLKTRISEAFGIAPAAQSLQCYGRILIGDALTLESLGIKDEAVIIVTQPGTDPYILGSYAKIFLSASHFQHYCSK
jgi:hypothetical protein